MNHAHPMPDFQENLLDLQTASFRVIALFAGVIGYLWLVLDVWTLDVTGRTYGPAPLVAWAGAGLLTLSATVGYRLQSRHRRIATHLLVWGILGATACAVVAYPSPAVISLLVLPVVFGAVLLDQPAFFLVAVLAGVMTLVTGSASTGLSSLSTEVIVPLAILAVVTLGSWLSTHNLYTALEWVWSGYERARHNEQVARQRQAELKRALKALDEAYYRLERANYSLTVARDQAEEARRLKQLFAQTISHELRTPLNLIVGFTEVMIRSPEYYGGQLSPAYVRDLRIVYRNARHLESLVNDVLDLARIEAAQMGLVPEATDPAALVQEAVDTARSLVETRGLTLRTEIESDLPRLWVDPTRIRQVLFNLLNNAARFTKEGGITVSARHDARGVLFAVADTGVGIAPEDLHRIFEEFHQVDGGTRRRHGGIGLGLAISKRFVNLHGGQMWVESQVGQGSTFYFVLPPGRTDLAATTRDDPATGETELTPVPERKKPILLAVTPGLSAATLLTRYVQGCRTLVIPDLEQAQEVARQLMPQAVVIDQACGVSDPARLEALAQAWGLSGAPFMACPLPREDLLRQQLRVDGYLTKPVSRQGLWDVLRQFGEGVDKVLVIDDDDDFVQLLTRMLRSSVRSYQVISAYSGQEGLAMMRHRRPDLVLLDLMLPDVSGSQVAQQIRAAPEWGQIPIIIISAQDETDIQQSLSGTALLTQGDGLTSADVVRWIQDVVDATLTPPPAPPTSPATSAL